MALCLEDKYEMIVKVKSIGYLCILTSAYWIPCLRKYGSELGRDLRFELGFSVEMVLRAPFGYPLGYYINKFLGLAL